MIKVPLRLCPVDHAPVERNKESRDIKINNNDLCFLPFIKGLPVTGQGIYVTGPRDRN